MMHDLWWYHGDVDFLRAYLPGMRDVLGWFNRGMTPSGMLGRLKWWNFVDWPDQFDDGRPPEDAEGRSAMLSLQFAAALHDAADLEDAYGSKVRRHTTANSRPRLPRQSIEPVGMRGESWWRTRPNIRRSANTRVSWRCSPMPFPPPSRAPF